MALFSPSRSLDRRQQPFDGFEGAPTFGKAPWIYCLFAIPIWLFLYGFWTLVILATKGQ